MYFSFFFFFLLLLLFSNRARLSILLMFNISFTLYRSTLCYAENGKSIIFQSLKSFHLYKSSCCVTVSDPRLLKQWWRTVYCCVGTFKRKKSAGTAWNLFHCDKTFNGILRIDEKHNCDIVLPLLSSSAKCVVSIFVFFFCDVAFSYTRMFLLFCLFFFLT